MLAQRFLEFMPASYARLYGPKEIADHAAIAARRGDRLVHTEFWSSPRGPILCVVADDRPGLLALITDALLVHDLAIESARVFCREIGKGRSEAVDFLELRGLAGRGNRLAELDEAELGSFLSSLNELILEDTSYRRTVPSGPHPDAEPPTRVYFERKLTADGHYSLIVEAPDAPGLLHAISSVLNARNFRIISCEIRTVSGHAHDRFELEPYGRRPVSDADLCDVQISVLDALPSRR